MTWLVTLGKEVIGVITRDREGVLRSKIVYPWHDAHEEREQPTEDKQLNRAQRRWLRRR